MKKQEFVKEIAKRGNVTVKEAEKAFRMVFDTLTATLEKGEEIQITGFGKFRVADTAEHKAINPKTKEEITISAGKAVRFTAGTTLKDIVNGRADK